MRLISIKFLLLLNFPNKTSRKEYHPLLHYFKGLSNIKPLSKTKNKYNFLLKVKKSWRPSSTYGCHGT